MKKKIVTDIVCVLYFLILLCVINLQLRYMQGEVERVASVLAVLVLAVPAALLVFILDKIMPDKNKISEKRANSLFAEVPVLSREAFETYCIRKSLSSREIEVARLAYLGYSNQLIAEELYISEYTVKKHMTHVYEKLEISGRKELQNMFMEIAKMTLS